jgi:hypothetical protein
VPVSEGETVDGVVPLMAVDQLNNNKVRPVLDFRALNSWVSNHSGSSAVCDETLRSWRRKGTNVSLLDLKKAYLQLHVHESLWRHQAVRYKGENFYLTRLGFGLNCAPRIMSKVLQTVLALAEKVQLGTNNYIDDIMVDESVVSVDQVANHLHNLGLVTKEAVKLDGTKVLLLQVRKNKYYWSRGNDLTADTGRTAKGCQGANCF